MSDDKAEALYERLFIPVNLSTASEEEIELIPGMDDHMVGEFLEYRPYDNIETFNREIGKWKNQKFHPKTGEVVSDREYEQQIAEWLPNDQDKNQLLDIINNEPKWISPKEGARDPLSSIGEVRKSAINI